MIRGPGQRLVTLHHLRLRQSEFCVIILPSGDIVSVCLYSAVRHRRQLQDAIKPRLAPCCRFPLLG